MVENKRNLPTDVEKAFGVTGCFNNHGFSRDRCCVYCSRKLQEKDIPCISGVARDAQERQLMVECIERMTEIIEMYREENTKLKNKEFGCSC